MRIELRHRNIPRNEKGDPCFKQLGQPETFGEQILPGTTPTLHNAFTNEEITELVNRSLYQILYQADSHTKRRQEQQRMEMPMKRALKVVHPGTPWSKATPEQVRDAAEYYTKHPELVKEGEL